MGPIAEVAFDLSYTSDKMGVRLYAPERVAGSSDWACTFEVDEPLALNRTLYGVSSLQALVLKSLSSNLYGSEAYRNGQLGVYGEFGGDLAIPATSLFLDMAPYPF